MAKERGLGRRHSPDDRDKLFLMTRRLAAPGTVLPPTKTWPIAARNFDQGATGTCVGQAWANFLRCAPIQSQAGVNEEYAFKIYDMATQVDEWQDNDQDVERQFGTSIRAGAEAVTSLGRLKSYLWAFTLQPAVEWVLTQGPIVLGTLWYNSMFSTNSEGVISVRPSSGIAGGHAYLLRGVNTRTGMATCSNSWGDDWGKSGNFYISLRDLEHLILADGECCTAVEARLKPAKTAG